MSLCLPRSCGCSISSDTLEVARSGEGFTIEMPDAYAGAYPLFIFLNTAERDAELTAPVEGMEAWTRTDNKKWRHDGTTWKVIRAPEASTGISSGSITLGTGGISDFFYRIQEDLVYFVYRMVLGTGGSLSGNPSLSLPVAARGQATGSRMTGEAGMYDNSASTIYAGIWDLVSAGTALQVYRADGGGAFALSATNPFTWAVNDELWAAGVYPKA
jgi:hypothetical protein